MNPKPPPVSPTTYLWFLRWTALQAGTIAVIAWLYPEAFSGSAYTWATTLLPAHWWAALFAVKAVMAWVAARSRDNNLGRAVLVSHTLMQSTFAISIATWSVLEAPQFAAGCVQWMSHALISAYLLGTGAVMERRRAD